MLTHPGLADWGVAQKRNASLMHPVEDTITDAEQKCISFPLQQQQQQHHPGHHVEVSAACAATQLLEITSCSTTSDQSQQQLLAGPSSGTGKLLGAVMHSIETELQRKIQHFAGAVVQRHKQTLLKEIQSLNLTVAAGSGQAVARAGPRSCSVTAANGTHCNCSCNSAPTVDGRAAETAPPPPLASAYAVLPNSNTLHDAAAVSAAAANSSSPPLPLTSSGSNEPRLLDQMARAESNVPSAAAAASASCSYSQQPKYNSELSTVAATAAGDVAGAKLPAAAAGGCNQSSAVAISPFARQCQQAAICQLLQAPEQQQQHLPPGQQQQQHLPPAQQQQPQVSTNQLPFAAQMNSRKQQTARCRHSQQQQKLPQSPAAVSQHSVAPAASDNAAAVHLWQYDQLSDEDMQQLLDAIVPDAAEVAQDEPISENIFAEIDALINDSTFLDFPEPDADLNLNPGPSAEFALLQLNSLSQQQQQQQQNLQQHFGTHCNGQQQQLQQQPMPQQQQQRPYATLRVDAPAAPFTTPALTSVAASNFSPAAITYSHCMQQLQPPCAQPGWQQQQQQLPMTTSSCRSAASDNVYNSDTGCNRRSGKSANSRVKGSRAAAAAAAAKAMPQKQQQQKKKRVRKVEAAIPVKRANSDRGCSSGAAAALRRQQWSLTQPQSPVQAPCMQLQSQQTWPHSRQLQQQTATTQSSINLAAQLPAWLTRQVAITQSLISGTR